MIDGITGFALIATRDVGYGIRDAGCGMRDAGLEILVDRLN
ncbi:hypothetical protein [Coraliomargarita sinensis]|nr:hypothetical protein [Coraliomargarita sinensis]